jgi:hypothetical protein
LPAAEDSDGRLDATMWDTAAATFRIHVAKRIV